MNYHDLRQAPLYYKIPVIAALRQMAGHTRTAASRSILKVAERWLLADGMIGYDLMARLQLLEGAAGQKAWTWSRNPRQGLREAAAFFADQSESVNPAWFSGRDTGMVSIIKSKTFGHMQQMGTGIGKSPDEIITNVLMGMGASGHKYPEPSLVGVGRDFRVGILSGKETPASMGAGPASRQAVQRAIDEIRAFQRAQARGPQVQDDEETGGQIQDYDRDPGFEQYIWSIFGSNTPQGKQLRAMFLASASGDARLTAEAFVEFFREKGTGAWASGERDAVAKLKDDIAAQLGITRESVTAHLTRSIIPNFQRLLKRSPLYEELQEDYVSEYHR